LALSESSTRCVHLLSFPRLPHILFSYTISLRITWEYGPVDDKIDQLLELKQERIETILRGRGKHLRGLPGIRALAKEIMESVHTGTSLAEILRLDPSEVASKAVDLVRDPVAVVAPTGTSPKSHELRNE
jgi:hypothetical protein